MDAVCLGTAGSRLPTVPLSMQGHRYMQGDALRAYIMDVHYGTVTVSDSGRSLSRYIKAEVACGEYSGNILLIPRIRHGSLLTFWRFTNRIIIIIIIIPLSPTDAGLPFTLRRRQLHSASIRHDHQQGSRADTTACWCSARRAGFHPWTTIRCRVTLW